jgi:hypothetical protein
MTSLPAPSNVVIACGHAFAAPKTSTILILASSLAP